MELDVQHRLFEAAENGQEHIIQEVRIRHLHSDS